VLGATALGPQAALFDTLLFEAVELALPLCGNNGVEQGPPDFIMNTLAHLELKRISFLAIAVGALRVAMKLELGLEPTPGKSGQ
jgi:hypothetical protein